MPKLVKPSLVIGLGSTGCQVVLALLRRLKQDPQPLPNCQFLLLDDTPLSAYWSEQREREGPRLVATFLQLGDRPAHTRAAARAACTAQAEVISRSIANAFAEMTAVSHRDALRARDLILDTRNADFYLLASLSGVLGSGCFLDVAYLVRDFMQRRRVNHTVKGFLLLPDVLASGDPVLREARAYAALRELDFLTERGQFAATYSDRLSVRVNDRPFDLCFLLDQTNEEGFNLGDPEAFYRVVAEICYTLLTTPVGRELDTALETLTVPPRYLDGKLGAYSSIGYSALIFPAQRAADYFSHRLAAELAGEVLLRSRENRGETERRLREFVARWNLRREDGAELEEAVLQAASGVEAFSLPPPPSFAEVPPEHLLTVIDTYYAELEGKRRAAEETPPAPTDPVEQELQRLKEQQARRQEGEVESLPPSLAQIEQQLLEMSREVERDLLAQIRALLDEPLTAGVRGTLTFLRQLQERLQTLRNRLTQRVQQRRNELPQKRKQVQQRRAALARSLQTVPSPLAQVGRAFLLWFVLVYALTAGLEFLFAQGYLTSPPLLAKIFAVGGEEVQNVLAALLLLTGFALHSALTCERSRTWVIRQRTRYVASRHDLLVAELGVRTAEAARVLVQRLSRVVQAYQEAVTAYRERLTRVHQTLQQEAEALREKLFQRHCVLEEAICTEDDYERLYREFVPQLEPVATALAQNHGPLHVWTRWEEGEVAARLREFALARLEAVRRLSAEDVINRQAEHLPPLQRLEQLYSAASPLLR
ncbi:MAG TPA: hypothetical protein EYP85_05815, partial [Armatimonadetes bacterium]|nr:hypothetical protein [Armatimonadota bacterium]